MWRGRQLLLFLFALVKCHVCSDFQPVRRYHPSGKFSSNDQDDLVTAENFQYAYNGGESQGVVDFNHDHKVFLDQRPTTGIGSSFPTSLGQTSSTALVSSQGSTSATSHGHDSVLTSGHGQITGLGQHFSQTTSHGQSSVPATAPGHVGEVDLTGSSSDLAGYSYGPPEHHGYLPPDHQGYLPPDHHEYLPPDHITGYSYVPPDHPLEYPKPPPQQAKQSPSYTYYYLGRHLWYIPLYFSIYFILYVGALVLKSVARHKILFPESLKDAAVAAQARSLRQLQEGQQKFYM